jgi:hypothetical protein
VDRDEPDRGEESDRAGDLRRTAMAGRDERQRHEDGGHSEQAGQARNSRELLVAGLTQRVVGHMAGEQDRQGEVREQEPAHEGYYARRGRADESARFRRRAITRASSAG